MSGWVQLVKCCDIHTSRIPHGPRTTHQNVPRDKVCVGVGAAHRVQYFNILRVSTHIRVSSSSTGSLGVAVNVCVSLHPHESVHDCYLPVAGNSVCRHLLSSHNEHVTRPRRWSQTAAVATSTSENTGEANERIFFNSRWI